MAAKAIQEGYQGRVTAVHTCALAAYDDAHAARVIELVKEAGMNMVTNPATNLMLQGRLDKEPRRRGITRVKELLAAGVNVCYGQDCLKDTFYPTFGQADLLEVGLITAHAAQLSLPQEIEVLFEAVARDGGCIGRAKDHRTVVARGGNIGELATVRIEGASAAGLSGSVLVHQEIEERR